MRYEEIVAGESYAYATSRYHTMNKVTVLSLTKEQTGDFKRSVNGYKRDQPIMGVPCRLERDGVVTRDRIVLEPRHFIRTWASYEAHEAAIAADTKAKKDANQLAAKLASRLSVAGFPCTTNFSRIVMSAETAQQLLDIIEAAADAADENVLS